jgi:hypothetical protein
MSENTLDKYKIYLEKALQYYYDDLTFLRLYKRLPKSRYDTFKFLIEYIETNNLKKIVELGTIRSYVDGRFEGCNMDDTKYWDENNPEKWDWSAGLFSKVLSECLPETEIDTVDINSDHLKRCKHINKNNKNINYIHKPSELYLKDYEGKLDIIYLDTGDMNPVEDVALLQLLEVQLIVNNNLLSTNGLIIIDDVYNPIPKNEGEESLYGKSKYSIPFLLSSGFEILMDEYQMILKIKS